METDRDLHTGTSDASASSAAGGQSNWEERFKGMQKLFNQKQAEFEALQTRHEARESALGDIASQHESLKKTFQTTTSDYEQKLAVRLAELTTFQQQLAAETDARLKAERQNNRNAELDTVRREIVSRHRDLLPWLESGFLKPLDETGEFLTGDALTTFLDGFQTQVGGTTRDAVAKAVTGGKPVVSAPATGASSVINGATSQDLADWLAKNPNSPDWDQTNNAYMALIRSGK